MKEKIFLVLFIMLIGITINVLSDDSCKCCFVLLSPTCQTRSINSCSDCTASWCKQNVDFCADSIPPCYTRCNT